MAHKTQKEYESLFITLMNYTDFEDVSEIRTDEDLRKYFSDIKKDAEGKGRSNPISAEFKSVLTGAYERLISSYHEGAERKITKKRSYSHADVVEIVDEIFYDIEKKKGKKQRISAQEIDKIRQIVLAKLNK